MISRRHFLLAGAGLPLLSACASDIISLSDRPPEVLTRELGVGAASYVVLRGGKPVPAVALSGKPDAIFQAASLTKPVVALAALRLVQAGRLEPGAPVSRYLPGGYKHFHNPLRRAAGDAFDLLPASTLERVTVAQLLNHSAGFPNWSSGALSFKSEPGARWGYSGEGYVMLQEVIEAVTQTGLAAYLEQQLFAPLGMVDSSLVWRDAFAGRAVGGAMMLGVEQRMRFQSAVAASSLYTTAADYARFMSALLTDESLLAMTLSTSVEADKPLGLAWGLGWGIEQGAGGPYLWQWGNNPGFRAFAMASTVSKDGFVVLTNNANGMPLAASLARLVLPAEHNAFRFSWVS
ncbi:serine hydrolase domain-containing protein [Pseudoduganella sp.]|uniref:serine hydrolase domain-containing protein n=1 Tax=Pseudoduganella sp. TaxID=1880898 RepID=UPI0035B3F6ED